MSTTATTATHPYALALGDGRTLVIELPASSVEVDPDGELLLKPAAVRLLDKVRATATDVPDNPSPGWIRTFRNALGLTQAELGEQIGVDKLSVSRWERGQVSPRRSCVQAIRRLRSKRVRKGVVVERS